MLTPVSGVLGSFRHIDAATAAIRTLKERGRRDFTVYSPAPNHELEEALKQPVSPVRVFTLVGGITGCLAGLAITFWTSLDWPLKVGGKPIATIPPYVVILFELTVLCGALVTVASMIILSAMKPTRRLMFDPSFTDDTVGIFVPCGREEFPDIEGLLRDAGSTEVRHEAA